MLFYKAGKSSHKIFVKKHEPKQIELEFSVALFYGLISLVKLFGNEGKCDV